MLFPTLGTPNLSNSMHTVKIPVHPCHTRSSKVLADLTGLHSRVSEQPDVKTRLNQSHFRFYMDKILVLLLLNSPMKYTIM